VELAEGSADVVEEGSGVLGVVVVGVVGEVLVAEAGVVVLVAGVVEGSGEEVDHRAYKVRGSSVRFLVQNDDVRRQGVAVLIVPHLFSLLC
jgi:ABC-type thiamin/hydroxymethylpyrimidine transport system permease subunit